MNQLCEISDWNLLKLSVNLAKQENFVLVNEEVWRTVKKWYGGGPEIPIFIIGKDKKSPDLNPVCITFSRRDPMTEKEIRSGLLISLQITDLELIVYIASKMNVDPASINLKYKNPTAPSSMPLHKNNKTLKSYNIRAKTVIFVSNRTTNIDIGPLNIFEEDKNEYYYNTPILNEEEMMNLAIEESLKDMGKQPENKLQPITVNENIEETKEKSGKVKTPSTGENTPLWKSKGNSRNECGLNSNYQYLAYILEQYFCKKKISV